MRTIITISLLFLLFSRPVNAQCWQDFTIAPYHNLAQKTDGTLWAWGTNFSGQLGNGLVPDQSLPIQVGTATDWQLSTGGAFHSLAIKDNGTLWGWGWNDDGQLGTGAANTGINPLLQVGAESTWSTVAAGGHHTVAIKNDGSLWAWGRNDHGQIGIGIFIADKVSPTQIGTATDWNQIAAGLFYAAAIKSDGTLWAWGENQKGQLGNGSTNDNSIPVQIGAAANWQHVATGYSHTVAVKTNGTLWAWGDNTYGQLGSGSYIDQKTPIQIGTATNWKQVQAGLGHTIALKTDGTIWAWGWNGKGQVGNGSYTTQNAPVQISSATDWQQIGAGEAHTMALKNDGTLWAWGWNQYGQLGNGTTTDKNIPTQIACPITSVKAVLATENLQISPNPVHDYITLQTTAVPTTDLTFEVTTLLGQVIINRRSLPENQQIDVTGLASGVYLVILHSATGQATRQFVKL